MRGIIHIGAEKTGTTTLQEFFSRQRDHLRAHGIAYPTFAGHKQHSTLAFYCMDPSRDNHQTRMNPALSPDQRDKWKAAFRSSAFQDLMSGGAAHDLLVSTELFHSNLTSCEDIQRLKALLDLWCDSYRILFYMRRQDELAVSLYSTYLRTGGSRTAVIEPRGMPIYYYDYDRILDSWAAVFGQGSIVPRLFDGASFVDGDLVSDFFSSIGLDNACVDRERPPRRNTALTFPAQALLRKFNECMSPAPDSATGRRRLQVFRRRVADILEESCHGASALPSRTDAQAFYEPYREGNARVATKWFGRRRLFDEDFGAYPLQAEPLGDNCVDYLDEVVEDLVGIARRFIATPTMEGDPSADHIKEDLKRILARFTAR